MSDFGVYVHVPFCRHRCDYCAFATWTDREELMADYIAACRREIADAAMPPATSVFFGGGTPSLLPSPLLMSVLEVIEVTERHPGAEVTVECNPETVTPASLADYRAGGVNRLSFGVQSLAPHVLAGLGRDHDPATVERAVRWARSAGFDSISLDLIFGGAGESLADWAATLEAALALEPEHISAYALTVEPGTPLARDRRRWPDDDDQADKYLLADEQLEASGFHWYEISNWARPGRECRHNQLYWAQGDYRGVGCSAHSHSYERGRRWWNVRTPERYLDLIGSGGSPIGGEEILDAAAQELEGRQLALRTCRGVDAATLAEALEGLVTRVGGRAVLTLRGRLLANEVAARLDLADPVCAPDMSVGSGTA